MVLHQGQPFNQVFGRFIFAQVVAGTTLKFSNKPGFNSVSVLNEIGAFDGIVQNPGSISLTAKGPAFGKLLYVRVEILPRW
jgi:hypothetical protein